MSYKQIQLMQRYLINKGFALSIILHMTVTELIDLYYKERGVTV